MSHEVNKEPQVFGDQRIFQAVFNDLDMRHEIVTLKDGTEQYAYVYEGVDPYELKDSHFPAVLHLIKSHSEAYAAESKVKENNMVREIRLAVMQKLIELAVDVCPRDSLVMLNWFSNMPFDFGIDDTRNKSKEV